MTDIMDLHWDKISPEPNSGCWLWTGAVVGSGRYGKVMTRQGLVSAHRFSWFLKFGYSNQNVLHSCDTGLCVNPDHLFVGSQLDNVQDMISKGRQNFSTGEAVGSCKLSVGEVIDIRLDNRSYSKIANDYNMSKTQIGAIKRKERWKHV